VFDELRVDNISDTTEVPVVPEDSVVLVAEDMAEAALEATV